ncbi:6298_t:CDS:1 [Racocetra fulgida]|uniref:6298_t:CDS:1 n=1 Tax=Racocetra fulgida TaxID=60492 RepID=A0A9N9CU59_9GLOM|nr:6298_t:CDS:1 [Racocetra fulgida]
MKKCVDGTCKCKSDGDCPASFPYCYLIGQDLGDCRVCKSDSDCSAAVSIGWFYCIDGNCKACRDHSQCPDGYFCNDGGCQECQKDSDCPSALGSFCNLEQGMCCTKSDCTCDTSADCSEYFPNCIYSNFYKVSRCRGCYANSDCTLTNDPELKFCHNNLCCKQEGCVCKTRFDCPGHGYCGPDGYCKKCPLQHNFCPYDKGDSFDNHSTIVNVKTKKGTVMSSQATIVSKIISKKAKPTAKK